MFESRRHGVTLLTSIVRLLALHRRHVADRFEKAPVVKPVDPLERCELHGFDVFGLPANTWLMFFPLPHPLKLWGLRESRGGSSSPSHERQLATVRNSALTSFLSGRRSHLRRLTNPLTQSAEGSTSQLLTHSASAALISCSMRWEIRSNSAWPVTVLIIRNRLLILSSFQRESVCR